MDEFRELMGNKLNEECGCFGIYNVKDAASLSYFGLHALQHRGQEACGIAASDNKNITCYKGKGLISEVFTNKIIEELPGKHAVGHVRYSTAQQNQIENVQPIMVRAHQGSFALVNNGQIVNAEEIKVELENQGSIFQGTSDSEIFLHLIQREEGTMVYKIMNACAKLEGAFAVIIMTKDCMYAVRDKNGLRPLSIAKLEDGYCVSSESCAYDIVNAKFVRDVEPGEVIRIASDGIQSFKYTEKTQKKMCSMEYIYFARPDSVIEGVNVHNARKLSGKLLARKDKVKADIVIGVPDSSLSAAIGYAEESRLPYEIGLIKNRYVGRTFIQPTQKQRERGVRMKLSAISAIVKGKRIVMIDDSIVRGTTMKRIVQLLKDAGAKAVHVRIASPEFKSPCFYGVDTSTYDELISSRLNVKELKEYIGADSLKFLTIDEVKEANGPDLCVACFSGKYPTNLFSLGNIIKK
ncbi:amidophosphoribosyltransferase [Anaerorhabdus furcosa]|uniref:Amidophosphoribosyltransferase n=1 Tax=Anaerorhabdus furcosa TaxID=118967 RepID=A0A1T4QC87_9FIRM|nr:amidophosphoribosyltransferase [Anaerorhabdus furcosa]SKA01315.1 amidophosphoribosyltransferase [Anaerorhabdus furcosa]